MILFLPTLLVSFAYFKIASAFILDDGLGLSGALMTALVFTAAAFLLSGWLTEQQLTRRAGYRRFGMPAFAAAALFIATCILGPLIAVGFSPAAVDYNGDPGRWFSKAFDRWSPWAPPYLIMTAGICVCWFGFQVATRRSGIDLT